jgi:aspartyl protease family protein
MLGWALKQVLLWTACGALGVLVLSDPGRVSYLLQRLAADGGAGVVEDVDAEGATRVLVLRAGHGGHFWVDAEVGGATVRFIVDTGATSVVLSPEDADRIGLVLGSQDYTEVHRTAGGLVRAAPVLLSEIRIGSLKVRNVEASVNPQLSGISLLGMSFLRRLQGYEVQRDRLRLYW